MGKESKYLFWNKIQKTVIPPEQIPPQIDLSKVIQKFSSHKHHTGAWPNLPTPTPTYKTTSINGICSHIVRKVQLTINGGLEISFDFFHTLRGEEFMNEYYQNKDDFVMVPILDKEELNIVRFDFFKEVKDENT